MGLAKRAMEEYEDLTNIAINILCEVGAIKVCENHGYFFDGNENLESAYKLANHKISYQGLTLPKNISRHDFSDIIKEAYESNSGREKCYGCEKNEYE